jgi:hypothetical protein
VKARSSLVVKCTLAPARGLHSAAVSTSLAADPTDLVSLLGRFLYCNSDLCRQAARCYSSPTDLLIQNTFSKSGAAREGGFHRFVSTVFKGLTPQFLVPKPSLAPTGGSVLFIIRDFIRAKHVHENKLGIQMKWLASLSLLLLGCSSAVPIEEAKSIAASRLASVVEPRMSIDQIRPVLTVSTHGHTQLVEFIQESKNLMWAVIVKPDGSSELSRMAIHD